MQNHWIIPGMYVKKEAFTMLMVGACYSHLGWKSEMDKDFQHYKKDYY